MPNYSLIGEKSCSAKVEPGNDVLERYSPCQARKDEGWNEDNINNLKNGSSLVVLVCNSIFDACSCGVRF
jgi:hypothetical protein